MKVFKEYSIIITLIGVDAFAYGGIDSGEACFQSLAYLEEQDEMPIVFKNDELEYVDVSLLDSGVTNVITVERAVKLGIVDHAVAVKYFDDLALLQQLLQQAVAKLERPSTKPPKPKLVSNQTPTQAPSLGVASASARK